MKVKLFTLIILAMFAVTVVSDLNAGLRSEGRKALSKAKKLVKSSRSTNDEVIAALKTLETWSDKAITEFLVEVALPILIRMPDKIPSYNQAIKTLEMMTDADSQKYLKKQVFNDKVGGSLRAKIFDKILNESADKETIIKAFEDEAWEMRARALAFINIRTMLEEEFFPYLKTLIKDEIVSIKSYCVTLLKKYANKDRKNRDRFIEIAEIFIERLENDKSRIRGDVIKALEIISELKLGDDVGVWKSWLNKIKKGESIEPKEGDGDKTGVTVTYHGIETYSKRLVYIIDTSSSMEEDIDPELTRTAKKQGEETKGEKEGDGKDAKRRRKIDWSKIKTKFDLARAELLRSMWALPEPKKNKKKSKYKDDGNVGFSIIAYNSTIDIWEEKLVEASEKNKVRAEKWIKRLKTGKKTNIYGALATGFNLAEGKLQKNKKPAETGSKDKTIQLDTIFFLTDGYATTGRYFGGIDEIKKIHDTNFDGKLSRAEFRKMFSEVFTEEEVMDMFDDFDVDKDGSVTYSKGRNTKAEFDESVGKGGKQSNRAKFYYFQMEGMLREIGQRNQLLRIQIHTIAIGKSSEADYTTMRKLAQMTGGDYVRLGALDDQK
ncbi:MAG: hypothetical protein K8S87_05200 [Planctomycetes bacterium]|nr:hypothetical protein [Planctomycetota bacterium]